MGGWIVLLGIIVIFGLLGAVQGICHGLSIQICPECLSEMTRGARRCPRCHAAQPVRKVRA
jgi:hypothetical protein